MNTRTRIAMGASALAMATLLATAGAANAQATNATLRGVVTEGDTREPGGSLTATEVSSGFVSRARISADGAYVLSGLRPGTYRIDVTSADGSTATDTVTLTTGQVGTLNLDVAPVATAAADGDATQVGEIVVTGRRIFEVRTSEVATGVSQQQINNLPQINRNFLNFAALAPGVRVTEGETERTISAGGQTAQAINVFIDGQNQKATIQDGGVAGQDDSRGNPFPQAGVQEFRVISQNFKAEYEQAGASIITAVTRSGGNEFHGEVFGSYQNQDWISQDVFAERRGDAKPELKREQWGFALGGPILQDKLNFFVTYERKDEARANQVFLERTEYNARFASDLGTFAAPFEEDLAFGKLSWQIDDRQRLEVSGTYRTEQDIRDFGNQNAVSRANAISTDIRAINARHTFQGNNFLNELTYDFYSYSYNPTAQNFTDYGRSYVIFADASSGPTGTPGFQYDINSRSATVFNTGGQSNNQFIEQKSHTFRDDLTFPDVQWMGTHTIKLGAKYSMQNYYVNKELGRNPQFIFDIEGRPEINGSADIPVQVTLGVASTVADVDNNVIGLYAQDDWQITDKLELNIGIRWDYEDNAYNNDYQTPAAIRSMLGAIQALPGYDFPAYFNPSDYITDGRDAFTGAFQPRFGFSYDVFGDERTVVFGGAGRYYDRVGFNFAFDERFKPTQFTKTINFSRTGGLVGGQQTVAWDPRYLTAAGLDPLLAATPNAGEVFLIKNDAEPPMTDQFNFGVRQKIGIFQTALTLSYTKTQNLSSWNIANALTATGDRFAGPTPGSVGFSQYNNLIFFQNTDKEAEYKAMFLTIDKPYDRDSNWGLNVAYTLSKATQNGSRDSATAAFDFDYNVPATSPWYPSNTDERHRIVASGTLGLPYDFMLSGILTLGSGLPFNVFNCPDATNPNICWNGGRPDKKAFLPGLNFAFRQIDLRLTKTIPTFDGQEVQFAFDAINIFNFRNYSSFEGDYNNAKYGFPNAQFLPTRSFQVGLRYTF